MRRAVGALLGLMLVLGAGPAIGHIQGQLTASATVTGVNRTQTYVRVRGKATITNNEPSTGPVPAPGICEIVAKVKGAGSQEDYVDRPLPGRTSTQKWKISIPDPDGDSARTAKARVAHCH